MALPETDRFRRPTLEALAEGEPLDNELIQNRVQESLGVSDAERREMPARGPTPIFTNRVAWALVELQRRDLIRKVGTRPNTYVITADGNRALAEGLDLDAKAPRRAPSSSSAGVADVDTDSPLVSGETYAWEELAARFDFEPDYLGAAGGMISRPRQNALLLMTHPGGARSIDYGDYWERDDLIYTGRGRRGDQTRDGQNRDLGENRRDNYVFEPAGARQLRFLGLATCIDEWTARHPDADGNERQVLRFRLRFEDGPGRATGGTTRTSNRDGRSPERRPREFDPDRAPATPRLGQRGRTPEETHALQEKAVRGHHDLVSALARWLELGGWTEIAEVPAAVDLWARRPNDSERVIFEAKTVRDGSEGARVRSAIAQLLEYRFFYGEPEDGLCLVCDRPISDRRVRLLDGLEIAVLFRDGEAFLPGSATAGRVAIPVQR